MFGQIALDDALKTFQRAVSLPTPSIPFPCSVAKIVHFVPTIPRDGYTLSKGYAHVSKMCNPNLTGSPSYHRGQYQYPPLFSLYLQTTMKQAHTLFQPPAADIITPKECVCTDNHNRHKVFGAVSSAQAMGSAFVFVHVEDEWRALVRSSSRNHCIAWQATIPLAKFAKVV
jgi:hypothetical protein